MQAYYFLKLKYTKLKIYFTICQKSINTFFFGDLLYEMRHDLLDIQYVYPKSSTIVGIRPALLYIPAESGHRHTVKFCGHTRTRKNM